MAAVAILDLWKAYLDNPRRVLDGLYRCANMGRNRPSTFDNMQVFFILTFWLQNAYSRHQNGVLGNCTPKWVMVTTRSTLSSSSAASDVYKRQVNPLLRYGDFSIFQDGGRPPSWICWWLIWTTHEEYLVVFITVQNFAGIG